MSLIQPLLGEGAAPVPPVQEAFNVGWGLASTTYPASFVNGKSAFDAGLGPQIWLFIGGQTQSGSAPLLPTYDGKAPDINFHVSNGTFICGWNLSQYGSIVTDTLNFDPSSGPLEWNGVVFYNVSATNGAYNVGVTPFGSLPAILTFPLISPGSMIVGLGMCIGAGDQTFVTATPYNGLDQGNGNNPFPTVGYTRYITYDLNANSPTGPTAVSFSINTTGGDLQNFTAYILSP
jgi:hypothetical protein